MPTALFILQKLLVNYFYRVNAGLFIFLFFVLFGLPQLPFAFHYSLITGIVQSQTFLGLVMLIWLLYNLKCIAYIIQQLQHQQQSFLFVMNCLSLKKIYLYKLFVHLQVYLPVLLYSIAIFVVALKKQQYLCALEIMAFNCTVLLLTPFVYVFALQQRKFSTHLFFIPSLRLQLRKPYFLFPLYFLFASRKQMLLITKAFSLFLLYGFIALYEPERHDIRPMQLCLLITAASHCAIIYEIRIFEDQYLGFIRNLPLNTASRFLRIVALYICLLLPELILLLKGIELQFLITDYPLLIVMPIALLCMFHVVLLLEVTTMEQLIRTVFGIIAGCFFIILYNYGFPLSLAILALAFILYKSYYYEYEKQ